MMQNKNMILELFGIRLPKPCAHLLILFVFTIFQASPLLPFKSAGISSIRLVTRSTTTLAKRDVSAVDV